jgi:Fur family transcriptional regulator, zinc uptake regulator
MEQAFPPPNHDHDHCVEDALERAEAVCEARHVRLTAIRRDVLELVWSSHAPAGAYDLMDRLETRRRADGTDGGGRIAPPTVYRALEFLKDKGLVHRIESLNAYVGCAHPGDAHACRFLICKQCGSAAEMEDDALEQAMADAAGRHGFSVAHVTLEIAGTCPECQAAGA